MLIAYWKQGGEIPAVLSILFIEVEPVIDYIKSQKERCIECGITDKAVLVYHHIKPEDKLFELSAYKNGYTKEQVENEISKCVVLCHNCHMKYHQEHPVRIRKEKGTKITVKKKKKTERKKNPLSFSQRIGASLNALPTYKLESIIEQCQQIIKDRE